MWTGTKAKELGLVDEIGGLDAALAEARKLGKRRRRPPTSRSIRRRRPLRDIVQSFGDVHSRLRYVGRLTRRSPHVKTIDPQLGAEAARLVDLALSFRRTQIQAIAVLPVIR